jgi:1-acyl-sn-glycerol-3-phosphate acyltransferase
VSESNTVGRRPPPARTAGATRAPTIADRLAARARVRTPGHFAPFFVRAFDGWLGRFADRWFRPVLEGVEHFPADGPFLVVANHSGAGVVEVVTLALCWHRRFGDRRAVTGMAHPVAFYLPVVAAIVRELGAIPSTYEAALRTLQGGVPVLVFPGGDHEAFRPVWQADRVDFNGRTGFLRLARAAWVPVVPLGIRGSHVTVPILWRSRLLPWLLVLPRLLGVKRMPVAAAALAGAVVIAAVAGPSLGWGWGAALATAWFASPLPALVLVPSRVRMRAGPALAPEVLFGAREDEGPLDDTGRRVEEVVRRLVHAA